MSKEAALNRACSSKSEMVDEDDEGEDAQEDQLSFIVLFVLYRDLSGMRF